MIKLIIFILIIANFFAVIFLSPLLVLEFAAKFIYNYASELFKKYFNYRKKIELGI